MSAPAPALAVLAMAEAVQAPAPRVWDVAAWLLAAADALQSRFGALSVRGELSGLSRAPSGHSYFALKDLEGRAAMLRCAMFRRAGALLDFMPQDGQQVELRGRLAVFEPRGEMQFIVESMQRVGEGALYERFLRLKAALERAGLFDAARKRSIAAWPRSLGLVTSTAAAALHDVLATLARRAPQVRVLIYPSLVQGADAPAALVAALQLAARRREVDTLLLVRGGGSLQDLWAFNEEAVVRAIAASPIPVVCGVGHESDVTLADLAADLRAATPTAAAELAAPAQLEAAAQLDALAGSLRRRVGHLLDLQAQRLDALAQRLGSPARATRQQFQLLQALQARLGLALQHASERAGAEQRQLARRLVVGMRAQLQARQRWLDAGAQRLQALDPRRVLARGYVWVTDESGRPVLTMHAVQAAERLLAVWADGAATVEVLQLHPLTPLA